MSEDYVGCQEKWFESERWFKVDRCGYEGLAETLISRLLEFSNIEESGEFSFVRYRMERFEMQNCKRVGCSSQNFLKAGQSLITLDKLFKEKLNMSQLDVIDKYNDKESNIRYLAETVAELTGLERFPQYMTMIFEMDALFLNDDRLLVNIGVIKENDIYRYCPVFDNGAALRSNLFFKVAGGGRARPFGMSYEEEVAISRNLYGRQLVMPMLTKDDIQMEMVSLLPYYSKRYQQTINDRVTDTIRKNQHLYFQ